MHGNVLAPKGHELPSILYALPGPYLITTGGSAVCGLSVGEELAEYGEVTVAFRRLLEAPPEGRCRVISLEDGGTASRAEGMDGVSLGRPKWGDIPYLRRLLRFAAENAHRYDVVLEHGWGLCGHLLAAFRRQGVPGAAVMGAIRTPYSPLGGFRDLPRLVTAAVRQSLARRQLRSAPRIIAETEQMKVALVRHLGLPAERVRVVGLGLDHSLFRPLCQASARAALGIPARSLVLLYVGTFGKYHDLRPPLEALASASRPDIEFHVVGDDVVGEHGHRRRYERLAASLAIPAVFHGRVARERVPQHIAAADLCLAPYDLKAFFGGEITSYTLKVPEYMACGRPVVTVPSGHLCELVTDGESGFLILNETREWVALLRKLPSRERLRAMGQAAAEATEQITWARTAAGYWQLCRELLAEGCRETNREVDVCRPCAS